MMWILLSLTALFESKPVRFITWSLFSFIIWVYADFGGLLNILASLMGFDLITRVWSLAVQNGGYREARRRRIISSRIALYKTGFKLGRYGLVFAAAGLFIKFIPAEFTYHAYNVRFLFASIITALIAYSEVESIFESLEGVGEKHKGIETVKEALNPHRLIDRLLIRLLDHIDKKKQ